MPKNAPGLASSARNRVELGPGLAIPAGARVPVTAGVAPTTVGRRQARERWQAAAELPLLNGRAGRLCAAAIVGAAPLTGSCIWERPNEAASGLSVLCNIPATRFYALGCRDIRLYGLL